ncbi:molybdenum cofactor guanylyltransferase [Melghirimyces profundicolus]|uniref:Probable molybdenum cofactor guanylyltransferase n=1 Tax=Melghirimyces profundicolus TaxID=1242148 RepID=A0A2T6BTG3_9BACL|nr:molybdenum cofactor guanylyltransferase [Melghirimyces profundicolus]PTX59326.1 molybdenum cofactor guanylyltransferase [Melghirimyces profundicolus]
MEEKAGLIILAGGRSRRMGRDKALLTVAGETMIRRLLKQFGDREAWTPLISSNRPALHGEAGVPVVTDRYWRRGPLAGIHAGLLRSPHALNLVIACDLPYACPEVGGRLLKLAAEGGSGAVVPVVHGRMQPLFAVYHRQLAGPMGAFLESEDGQVQSFLKTVPTRYVKEPFPENVFFNMNRPEDHHRVEEWERATDGDPGEGFTKS